MPDFLLCACYRERQNECYADLELYSSFMPGIEPPPLIAVMAIQCDSKQKLRDEILESARNVIIDCDCHSDRGDTLIPKKTDVNTLIESKQVVFYRAENFESTHGSDIKRVAEVENLVPESIVAVDVFTSIEAIEIWGEKTIVECMEGFSRYQEGLCCSLQLEYSFINEWFSCCVSMVQKCAHLATMKSSSNGDNNNDIIGIKNLWFRDLGIYILRKYQDSLQKSELSTPQEVVNSINTYSKYATTLDHYNCFPIDKSPCDPSSNDFRKVATYFLKKCANLTEKRIVKAINEISEWKVEDSRIRQIISEVPKKYAKYIRPEILNT
jgi:hypothetical protein